MSRVRPLGPRHARESILQRVAPIVDKARQIGVRSGLRSRRVFLVWTTWDGAERGEGNEVELSRMELLPTPRVTGLDAVAMQSFSAGVLPEGSIRVELVSVLYTEAQLNGFIVPPSERCLAPLVWNPPPPNGSFFYEVVEDGRGDVLPTRQKYRLASQVWRREGRVSWSFVLERISEDSTTAGPSRFAPGGGPPRGDAYG
jgi:hypothetical protein